jgi:hypothetical protein
MDRRGNETVMEEVMTYKEAYEKHAEKHSMVEGDAIDAQVAQIRSEVKAGKFNRAFLVGVRENLRRDLIREVELPHGAYPQVILRAARKHAALTEVLSTMAV